MVRRYDDRRWIQNPDGSFTRRSEIVQAAEVIPETASVEIIDHSEENYYKDIDTTGAAAALAADLGIDLSSVEGTGLHGRITKADVEAAAANA